MVTAVLLFDEMTRTVADLQLNAKHKAPKTARILCSYGKQECTNSEKKYHLFISVSLDQSSLEECLLVKRLFLRVVNRGRLAT